MNQDDTLVTSLVNLAALRREVRLKAKIQSKNSGGIAAWGKKGFSHVLRAHYLGLKKKNRALRRALDELASRQCRYADLFELAPVGYFMLDIRGLILEVNKTGAALLESSREMLLRKSFCEFLVETGDLQKFHSHIKDVFLKQAAQICEVRLQTNTMVPLYAQIHSVAAENTDGKSGIIRMTVIDISERRLAEEALKEMNAKLQQSETNYRMLMDHASDGIAVADPQGRYVDVNSRMCEMMGYSREQFLKLTIMDMLEREEAPVSSGLPELTVEKTILTERTMRRKDGSTFPSEISARVLPDGRLHATFRDITERKQTAYALKVTEDTLRTVTNSVKDAIVIMDHEEKVSFWNPAAEKMFGIASYEALGLKMHELIAPRRYLDAYHRAISAYQATGTGPLIGKTFEIVARKKDGTEFPVEVSLSSIRFKDKWYAAGIMRDISERKKAEELLRRSHDELESLVTERTAELTMLNEELRNLSVYLQNAREDERTMIAREIHDDLGQSLTALKIDFSLLRKKLPPADKTVAEKAESIAGLIEATTQSVKRISSDLRPGILDHLGLTAAIEWQAGEFEKRTGISCTCVFEPEEIALDKDRTTTVFRVFQETLTNIARHAQATEVSVHLSVQTDGLMLHVEDNGVGISEKQIADPKSLGLIGIRERVNYWGGLLTIDGIRDKGTTITVWIPLDTRR
jgi:PAS domain S-box-containing protein